MPVAKEGTAKLKKGGKLLADPTYFIDTLGKREAKITQAPYTISRWFFILADTDAWRIMGQKKGKAPKAQSCQIILTGKHCKRKYDVYVSVGGHTLSTAPKGMSIFTISSMVETKTEKEQKLELD